jgi:hypothetical protein
LKLVVALAVLFAIWWLGQNKRRSDLPSPAEARALLDLPAGATREEIVAAHRRLIARVHPDAGGTAALAARVNAARDVLIAARPRVS